MTKINEFLYLDSNILVKIEIVQFFSFRMIKHTVYIILIFAMGLSVIFAIENDDGNKVKRTAAHMSAYKYRKILLNYTNREDKWNINKFLKGFRNFMISQMKSKYPRAEDTIKVDKPVTYVYSWRKLRFG